MKQFNFVKQNKILSAIILLIISIAFSIIPINNLIGESICYPDAILVEALSLQGTLLILSCLFLKLIGDNKYLGLRFEEKVKDIYVIWPLVVLAIMGAVGSVDIIGSVNVGAKTIVLYVITFIVTSLFEEFLFRGVALKIFIDKYGNNHKGIIKAVIVSNLIFSLCSFNMLLSGQTDLKTVILRMFNMICMGVLYCAVFLRTKTIWVNVVMHSIIELTGSVQALTITSKTAYEKLTASSIVTMEVAIQMLLMSLPFLILGIFFLRKRT